jgi:hypothetical protein
MFNVQCADACGRHADKLQSSFVSIQFSMFNFVDIFYRREHGDFLSVFLCVLCGELLFFTTENTEKHGVFFISIFNVPTLSVGMLTFCLVKSSALNAQYFLNTKQTKKFS